MGGQGGRRGRRGGNRHHHRQRAGHHHHRGGGRGFNIFFRQGGAHQSLMQRRLVSSFFCFGFGIGLIFYGIAASVIYQDFPWQGFSFIGVGIMLILCSIVGFWKIKQLNQLNQRQQEQQAVSIPQENFGSQLTTQQQQQVWTTGQNMTAAPPPYGAGQEQPPPGYAATVGPMVHPQQPYPQPGGPVPPYTQAGGVASYPQYPTTPGGVQPFPPQTIANEPQLYHVQPYSASDGNTPAPYPPTYPSQGPAPVNSSVTMPPPPSYGEVVILNEQNNK